MDQTEQLALAYLKACGHQNIQYEPDGGVPPDFVIDGEIAVEVRRLNRSYHDGQSSKGLEEVARPLVDTIRKLLTTLGPPRGDRSWFVTLDFRRPLPPRTELRRRIREVLVPMLEERTFSPTSFDLTNRFRLDLMAASRRYDQAFLLGGWSDDDDAGWLLEDMETNLARCIAEKTRKIAPYRARYPLWWLLLVDHVGYGLDPFDQSLFRDQVTVDHDFNRVILVDPLHPARGFDI